VKAHATGTIHFFIELSYVFFMEARRLLPIHPHNGTPYQGRNPQLPKVPKTA
jgi:hypothetical protein